MGDDVKEKAAGMELVKLTQIGLHHLKHRVGLAPIAWCRARNTLATSLMNEYYYQRATEGGLHISKGVCMAANGFDGCEIHGAHDYLMDSFVKENIYDRTDAYGGFMKNRCKLLLEVTHAIISDIGAHKTAVRISPFSVYNAAGTDTNPEALLSYLLAELDKLNLAYIHLTEPAFASIVDNFIWAPQCGHLMKHRTDPLLVSGVHTCESGNEAVRSGYADLVGLGRSLIANPDLVKRFQKGAPLNVPSPATFYGDYTKRGYTDYPFLEGKEQGGSISHFWISFDRSTKDSVVN